MQLLPSLREAGRKCAPDGDLVNCTLADAANALMNEFNGSIQVHVQRPLFAGVTIVGGHENIPETVVC